MNRADRGKKHVCAECETKYYDLKRAIVRCPKCGSKPAKPVTGRRAAARRKSAA